MQNRPSARIITAAILPVLLLAGCSSSSKNSVEISIPTYTTLMGTVTENADGSISADPDSFVTILFDAALTDSTVRMTVSGRYDGTHLSMYLYTDATTYYGQEIFMVRGPDNSLFVNPYHGMSGSLGNFYLPGPYMVGDPFTMRLEVDSRAATRRVRFWGPGKDFTDTPDFDSDPQVLDPYGGMRSGLSLQGATIYRVDFSPVP